MTKDAIVITGYARTPQGSQMGSLSTVPAYELGTVAIKAAIENSKVAAEKIDEVIMGCVLPAGQGQAPARQAAIGAGIPVAAGATTVNKMCGSGMKALMLAHDSLVAGTSDIMIAGGMESMSLAPHLLPNMRGGVKMGHTKAYDHMFIDGLEDAYERGSLMGVFAERTATKYKFSREKQDEFAINSLKKAQQAIENGNFKDEIAPVVVKTRTGEVVVDTDEQPGNAKLDKIPTLRPAFAKDGTVTAANSSSISDGAAALVLMRETVANKNGIKPIAKILGHATNAADPDWFTTAPVNAIKKLLEKLNWQTTDVDLFEINEAFAVVAMAAIHDLNLDPNKVNIFGGACALGHPIGASGARITATLITALKSKNLKRGIAALCIGGGEATAMAIEVL